MDIETIYSDSFNKFYIKLVLDIGRYVLRSAGSSDCFFNLETTIASFCEDEKQPCSNDLLIISVNTGAKTSPICLTSHVGAESMMHCLFGAFRRFSSTSSVVTFWKRPNGGTSPWWIVGSIHSCFSYAIHLHDSIILSVLLVEQRTQTVILLICIHNLILSTQQSGTRTIYLIIL